MSRILSFTTGPEDWRILLADPVRHWRTGFSARTLAHCWEAADGFPPEVAEVFGKTPDPLLADLRPILAVPEFKVALPGGVRPSQNDIFVLAYSAAGPVSIMVEGKVNESFGPALDEWNKEASQGKKKRLRSLLRTLGLASPAGTIRYQLLHRAASAVIVAEQYRAAAAVLLIHSFSKERAGWPDYQAFARLFGTEADMGVVQRLGNTSNIQLFGVWVTGDCAFLQR
jgi:hypothetical protein